MFPSSDGSLLSWDMRQASKPFAAIRVGLVPIRQILMQPSTSGYVYAGCMNGLLSAVDLNCASIVWVTINFP